MEKTDKIIPFSEVTKFHGHVCPGSALGYRVGEIAIHKLILPRAIDEELLAVVENDSCSLDAIQVVTGCTMGKGNLIFKDHGKQAYTFMNRKTGEAVRISLKDSIDSVDPEFAAARQEAFSNRATEEDKKEFERIKTRLSEKILDAPVEDLFKVERVEMEFPEEARIFKSVRCSKCGEMVAEHRARVENGKLVCIPCFHEYSRN
ncbi:FmdE family protein [Methanobacterium aggregans]|uniref:FmdE family protein n=1 Tax=Methanobacterium aggregans TaxID=1615586 RepID=UPI0032112EA1